MEDLDRYFEGRYHEYYHSEKRFIENEYIHRSCERCNAK